MNITEFCVYLNDYMPSVPLTKKIGYLNMVVKEIFRRKTDNHVFRLSESNFVTPLASTDEFPFPYARLKTNLENSVTTDRIYSSDYITLSASTMVSDDAETINTSFCGDTGASISSVDYLFADIDTVPYDGAAQYVTPSYLVDGKTWATIPFQKNENKIKLLRDYPIETKIYVYSYIRPSNITTVADTMPLDIDNNLDLLTSGVLGYWKDIVYGQSDEKYKFVDAVRRMQSNDYLENTNSYKYTSRPV